MHELFIDTKQTIAELQKQFNSIFTFLKIEFFNSPPHNKTGNSKSNLIVTDLKLNNISTLKKLGKIHFTGKTTVSELENIFRNEFGLYVQVFRKSGKIWLETTATDSWSLEQQNEEGKFLEQHLNVDRIDLTDRDIY